MVDKKLKKDISFILLSTLLLIFYTISTYSLSYKTIAGILIPGTCFAFAFVTLSWILTDQSLLRKTWPYLTIFILSFIIVSFWKIIYFSIDLSIKNYQNINYSILEKISYLQIIVNFLIILTLVLLFWYLVKPKDFQDKKIFFLKKENKIKTILTISIPFFMTLPYWLNHLIYIFNKNFFSDLLSNIDLYHWYIFLLKTIPFFFAAIFFAILINNLKENKKYYLYSIIGSFVLIQNITFFLIYNITNSDFFSILIITSVNYGISFFIIFLSLLLLSKNRYLE